MCLKNGSDCMHLLGIFTQQLHVDREIKKLIMLRTQIMPLIWRAAGVLKRVL